MDTHDTWTAAFRAEVDARFVTQLEAAKSLRLPPNRVNQYYHGVYVPREALRRRIQRWSAGRVAAGLPKAVAA